MVLVTVLEVVKVVLLEDEVRDVVMLVAVLLVCVAVSPKKLQ